VLPAAALCRLARERGLISVVDGAHALGMVPVSIPEIQPDYYGANIHKWMMGPTGSALLYVAEGRRAATRPLVTTGTFAFAPERADESVGYGGPTRWIFSHEYQGTRNHAPLLAALEAVAFHREVPLDAVAARTGRLAARCRALFQELGYAPASHAHPELATCMTSFFLPAPGGQRVDGTKAFWGMREEHGFELQFPALGDGRMTIRISNAWFNGEEDLERLEALLKTVDWGRYA
jgi:isopenicillin-N epimerase